MVAADVHDWLLRWFNPRPTMLGPSAEDRRALYALARYPTDEKAEAGEIPNWRAGGISASGCSSASHARRGARHRYFDGMPHRVLITDRLRMPPGTGHPPARPAGDAINTLFDQMPEDT